MLHIKFLNNFIIQNSLFTYEKGVICNKNGLMGPSSYNGIIDVDTGIIDTK